MKSFKMVLISLYNWSLKGFWLFLELFSPNKSSFQSEEDYANVIVMLLLVSLNSQHSCNALSAFCRYQASPSRPPAQCKKVQVFVFLAFCIYHFVFCILYHIFANVRLCDDKNRSAGKHKDWPVLFLPYFAICVVCMCTLVLQLHLYENQFL